MEESGVRMTTYNRKYLVEVIKDTIEGWFPKADEDDLFTCAGNVQKILNLEPLIGRQWIATLPEPSFLDLDDPDVLLSE
jgi:hypothetical protein